MRTHVAALALAAVLTVPAMAQNTANPGSTNSPAMTMAPATQPSGTTAAPGTATHGSTNQGGMADRAANRATDAAGTAVRTEGNAVPTTATPATGANSFTEGQARSRIEAAGYTGVQDLKKDESGVWRGRAMRGGQTADVGLDFQGNVVTGNQPAR